VTNYESAKRSDTARFGRFFRAMLERGIYLAPSQFEAAFVSAAHSEEDIRATIAVAGEALSTDQQLMPAAPPDSYAFVMNIKSLGAATFDSHRAFTFAEPPRTKSSKSRKP